MEIQAIAAHVKAVSAAGDAAQIDARVVKGPGPVPLRMVADGEGVHVRPDRDEGSCGCRDREQEDATELDIEVHVPSGVKLVVRTVEGGVEVDGVRGSLDVRVVDGSIDLRSVASGRAHSTNGAIHAAFVGTELAESSELATVNGTVDVAWPAAAGAEVSARSVNGRVTVDFPVSGEVAPHKARGLIGHGGKGLTLRSVNGSIHVARGT